MLKSLHWLPIDKRIEYKILLTTHKARTGIAPEYLNDLLKPYRPPRALRSLNLSLLKKPRSRTKAGDRSYAVCAPHLWNKLPVILRQAVELDAFKDMLKTYLFKQAYPDS